MLRETEIKLAGGKTTGEICRELAISEQRKEVITGTVVECLQDARNDTYFYFDNGQVWKQKTDSRIKFGDCNFDVTITRDFFGYKMQLVGEARRIRIARVR